MIEMIGGGLSSLNAAMGLLKTLSAAANQAAINDIKLELQERIFEAREALSAAREAQSTSLERIRQLEQEIVRLKDWESEKERYELKAIDIGALAYVPKPGMDKGEPPHWLCTECFKKGQLSFLAQRGGEAQRSPGAGIQVPWVCNACGAKVTVFFQITPSTPKAG